MLCFFELILFINDANLIEILFQLGNTIPVNVIMFLPAALLGFIGGILGAVFTIANLKVSRIRRRLIARVKQPFVQNILRCLEPPLIMVNWACNGIINTIVLR